MKLEVGDVVQDKIIKAMIGMITGFTDDDLLIIHWIDINKTLVYGSEKSLLDQDSFFIHKMKHDI